ncbi:DNA alkylation repair protein [Shinella curvata]|uniref:DNA alkylation repair protein n=1 Tax=Shinella curvata TaxID=1817964 RepID=A0ABT8X8J2_9HYPH|nr:DNA alkylation repair protein [Shinella curvata]MCJ8052134.1 DNA alkylation repair protein [Shinella curvata]MDO6119918.1 DNA alkylation repair protein [Shinella curvata]
MIGKASTADEIVNYLRSLRSEEAIAGMERFGIVTETALGISNPDLRRIGRLTGKDHARAFTLWASGIREARMLALYTLEPKRLSADAAWGLAADFNSWEIVDNAADIFVEAGLVGLIPDFAADEREFVRRTAFAMIAGAAVHLKKEPDATLIAWLDLIEDHAGDARNFVKKAVNWALRNVGKRSHACHAPAVALAQKLSESTDKTARWIGKDAVRELTD